MTTFTTKDGLPHDVIHFLYPDAGGDLWIGVRAGWLSRFRDGRFTNYRLHPDDQSDDAVLQPRIRREGELVHFSQIEINPITTKTLITLAVGV